MRHTTINHAVSRAQGVVEDLLLTAARLCEGDAEEFMEDRFTGERPAFSERRVAKVLVSYAERIVADLGINPADVWTPDVLREQEFTTLGKEREPFHVERFIVTVAYDPEDRDWQVDGDLVGMAENADKDGGAVMRWTRLSCDKVAPEGEESVSDIAEQQHEAGSRQTAQHND